MEVENKFNMVVVDNKVVVKQTITKTMDVKESIAEFTKLEQEEMQVLKQKEQVEKYIEDKKAETDLERLSENVDTIVDLKKQWEEKTKPLVESLRGELAAKVKEAKKAKYNDEKEDGQKAALRAHIIGNIANEFQLDMNSLLITELRTKFDEL